MKNTNQTNEKLIVFFCVLSVFWFSCRCFAKNLNRAGRTAASTVFVRGEEISNELFKATLASESKAKSFVQIHLQSVGAIESSKQVRLAFARAQNALLSIEQTDSVPLWRDVVALKFSDHFKKSERDLIIMAHFRLAQLTPFRAETEQTWKDVLVFDPDAKPKADYFSFEYHQAFQRFKKQKSKLVSVQVPDDVEMLLVFGRPVPVQQNQVHLPDAALKVVFLSNEKRPYHWRGRPPELEKQTPTKREQLIVGSCGQIENIADEIRNLGRPVVFVHSARCLTPVPLQMTFATKDPRAAEIASLTTQTIGSTFQSTTPDFTGPAPASRMKKLFTNKWFYVGLAAVATGAIVYNEHRKNERSNDSPSGDNNSQGSTPSSTPPSGGTKDIDGF